MKRLKYQALIMVDKNIEFAVARLICGDHNSWGNALHWTDWDARKMHGWLQNPPIIGDIINAKMKSGKVAQFIVINVENANDPTDMFFCDLSDFGYREK